MKIIQWLKKNFFIILLIILYFTSFLVVILFEEHFKYIIIFGIPVIIILTLILNAAFNKDDKTIEICGFIIVALFNTITLYFLLVEKQNSNDFKRWENYNYFDEIYTEWLQDMPPRISKAHSDKDWKSLNWDNLDHGERTWVRRYFDLYAQEYYFKSINMIPAEMWTIVIHGTEKDCKGAAFLNFCEYPILLEGYTYWKEKGAFMHPKDFRNILDKKLKYCGYPKNFKCPPKHK